MNNRAFARLHVGLPTVASSSTPTIVRRIRPEYYSPPSIRKSNTPPWNSYRGSYHDDAADWEHISPSNSSILVNTPESVSQVFRYPGTNEQTASRDGYFFPDNREYYGSILKKQNGAAGFPSNGGTLSRPSQRERRKVAFSNSVSVHWYESDPEGTSSTMDNDTFGHGHNDWRIFRDTNGKIMPRMTDRPICYKNNAHEPDEQFRTFPADSTIRERQDIIMLGHHRNTPITHVGIPISPQLVQRRSTQPIFPPLVTKNRSNNNAIVHLNADDSVCYPKFTFATDKDTFQTKLLMSIQLGSMLHPYDVLVKANKNGNKIRVVFTDDAEVSEQTRSITQDPISLPIEVDPYQLNARLDQGGVLHVEAPVVQ